MVKDTFLYREPMATAALQAVNMKLQFERQFGSLTSTRANFTTRCIVHCAPFQFLNLCSAHCLCKHRHEFKRRNNF